MITLQNRERRIRHYLIPPETGGGKQHVRAAAVRTSDSTTRTGASTLRTETKVFGKSLILAAFGSQGDTSSPLPDHWKNVPAVQTAIASKRLALVQLAEAPAPAATTATPTAPMPTTSSPAPAAPSSSDTPTAKPKEV